MTNVIAAVIAVLIQVESQGRNTLGDDGRSAGVLQMKRCAVDEANRLAGARRWSYSDRWIPERARAMCAVTLAHHWRRGTRSPVELACRWRNPYSRCPASYRRAVRREVEEQTCAAD